MPEAVEFPFRTYQQGDMLRPAVQVTFHTVSGEAMQPVWGLLDTGSPFTMVPRQSFAELGPGVLQPFDLMARLGVTEDMCEPGQQWGFDSGAGATNKLTTREPLKLTCAGRDVHVPIAFIDYFQPGGHATFGQDFLAALGPVTVDCRAQIVRLEPREA